MRRLTSIPSLNALIGLHQEVSGRWLALIREIDRRHAGPTP